MYRLNQIVLLVDSFALLVGVDTGAAEVVGVVEDKRGGGGLRGQVNGDIGGFPDLAAGLDDDFGGVFDEEVLLIELDLQNARRGDGEGDAWVDGDVAGCPRQASDRAVARDRPVAGGGYITGVGGRSGGGFERGEP